jgi:N-acetylmuramoyl-L-alanine amidase
MKRFITIFALIAMLTPNTAFGISDQDWASLFTSSSDSPGAILYNGGECVGGTPATATGNTIVIDPGHSPSGTNTDEVDNASDVGSYKAVNIGTNSGVKATDNGGAPGEMSAMWDAAQLIKTQLTAAGYNVVLTKKSETDAVGLLTRAKIANDSKAALAVSLHYTGDASFGTTNTHWGVTPQEVGLKRTNESDGKSYTFNNKAVADASLAAAKIIAEERTATGDKANVAPLDNSFPKSRGLPAYGDISIVQLFSRVPWVYNEAGANGFDKQKYATGIANGIIKAVPLSNAGGGGSSSAAPGTLDTTNEHTQAAADAREKAIWGYLIAKEYAPGKKLSAEQVAGIMGNMEVESQHTWNPTVVQGLTYADTPPNHGGWGIVQWTPGTKILPVIADTSGKPNDLLSQLNALWDQLYNPKSKENENTAGKSVAAATDVTSAVEAFRHDFERNQAGFQQERVDDANAILAMAQKSGWQAGSGGGSGACGGSTGGSPDCAASGVTGTAKILCEAKKYDGLYYRYGGGPHGNGAYSAFTKVCPDPAKADRSDAGNKPNGASPLSGGASGGTSPCATDCSGIVSAATSAATGRDIGWTVSTLQADTKNWKKIGFNDVQAGDVVTISGEHIEIVDHYDKTANKLYEFGSHSTGTKTSAGTSSPSNWSGGAYRFIGAGI